MGEIDLDAYFARIGYAGPREASFEVLAALQRAHPAAIPFECLDPLLGRPVRIDAASLQAKLVQGGRGGYCFEQNGVLWRVLTQLGFKVTPLSARVRWMAPEDAPPGPLSHMLLKVGLPEGDFLCDVGFGGQSPTAPLRMQPGLVQSTPHGDYRMVQRGAELELQVRLLDRWAALYHFSPEPRVLADYEVSNWFTSTFPSSIFTNGLMASRAPEGQRVSLMNTGLTTYFADGRIEERTLASADELHQALTVELGLDVSPEEAAQAFAKIAEARTA
jgi:N-hydroxyarylamine O-acetyltransferase